MHEAEIVLGYWFGTSTDDALVAKQQAGLWWSKNVAADTEIRQSFESMVLAAETGALDNWNSTAEGRLALIILADQFPRNIYRDTAAAFRFDPRARSLCLQGLSAGDDKKLRPIQRLFFYLPLEHSENGEHQARCVALLEALLAEVEPALKPMMTGFLDFANKHKVIIDRFGRFPHRNAILQRESTPEELLFLQQPGSSF